MKSTVKCGIRRISQPATVSPSSTWKINDWFTYKSSKLERKMIWTKGPGNYGTQPLIFRGVYKTQSPMFQAYNYTSYKPIYF